PPASTKSRNWRTWRRPSCREVLRGADGVLLPLRGLIWGCARIPRADAAGLHYFAAPRLNPGAVGVGARPSFSAGICNEDRRSGPTHCKVLYRQEMEDTAVHGTPATSENRRALRRSRFSRGAAT